MAALKQGLLIAVTGMGGVFAGLILLMLAVMAIGAVFGRKPAPKKKEDSVPSAKAAEAQKDR